MIFCFLAEKDNAKRKKTWEINQRKGKINKYIDKRGEEMQERGR